MLADLDLCGGDLSENADGESGSGEGVAADEVGRDVEEASESADLV